jgi:PleD family two-component response regulator
MNILVADDDRSSQLIAQTALRRLGHECEIVGDGDQAWEAFEQHHHDVIISDSMMPGLTGSQLCQKIRAGMGDYTYFIMVTSLGVHRQVLEGMAAGVDDYLIKPLNPEDLQARLVAAERVTALHHQLADQRSELQRLNATLGEISRHDPLTGLRNRRALEEDLEMLEPRVARYGHRYCMALLDVDHFKAYNDTYGHQAGDEVLKAVAGQLEDQARSGDAVYRYGAKSSCASSPNNRRSLARSQPNACGRVSNDSLSRTVRLPLGSSP